ncbi:LamG domain-containing protein, partial [Patescibacteria group bacterium]|nr:LamG domain-containing protein [Patescibacteria group bacterium]
MVNSNSARIASRDSATTFFKGPIDDVRIYNRALSASEVSSLASGNPSTGSGYYTLGSSLDLTGNLNNYTGNLVSSGGITIQGNWNNQGDFTHDGGGTVNLNGTNQLMSGSTVFWNLTSTGSSSDTLRFDYTSRQNISGSLVLSGDSGQALSLRSTKTGSASNILLDASAGTQTLTYLDIKDSDASGGTELLANDGTSTDSGNTTNWDISTPATTVTITGVAYSDEGTTPLASKTVSMSLNGGAITDSGTTDAGGMFTLSGATMTGGTIITVFIDNETEDAVTVTVSSGSTMTGVHLYQDRLIIRSETGAMTQPSGSEGTLTSTHLDTANNSGDADINAIYTMSSLNVTTIDGKTLYIWTGSLLNLGGTLDVGTSGTTSELHLNGSLTQNNNVIGIEGNYTQSGGTFTGSNGGSLIDIDGKFILVGGVFTATSGTWEQSGDMTISSGSLLHGSGSITFNLSSTINIGSESLNDVVFNSINQTWTITDTMDVNGDLTIAAVTGLKSGDINVAGNVTTTSASCGGSPAASIVFDGAGDQTLGADGGTGAVPAITINKTSGTLTIEDHINVIGYQRSWTYTAGTVDAGTSVIEFKNQLTIDSGAMSFNDVIFNFGNHSWTITDTMDVNGDLTIAAVAGLLGGNINVAGNVTTTSAICGGSSPASIVFDGTENQTLSADGGTGAVPAIAINKEDGTLTIEDTINVNGYDRTSWTYTAGTVDAGTSKVQFVVGSTIDSGTMSFNDVVFNFGNHSWTITDTMDVNGDLTFTALVGLNAGKISVAGNVSITDADVNLDGGANITLDGTGSQTLNLTTAGALDNGNVNISKSAGQVIMTSDFTLDVAGQDLILTGGTLDLSGYNLSVADQFTIGTGTTLKLHGNETITGGPDTVWGNTTVHYNDEDATITMLDQPFWNLIVGSTGSAVYHLANADSLALSGSLTISGGTLAVTNGQNITLSGSLIQGANGTFTAGTGTVTLDGIAQTLSGAISFNNLTKTITNADTLTFSLNGEKSISGALTLQGAVSNLLSLRSESSGTAAPIRLDASTGTQTLTYLDVKDSDASGGVELDASDGTSTDSENNTNWSFPAPTVTITGTAYSDEGTTPLASKTIALSVSGATVFTSAETDAGGQFTITSTGAVASGAVLTLFLDDETEDAVTVTVSSGSTMTGVHLYQDHLIIRSETGAMVASDSNIGTVTSTHLAEADDSGDSDITAIYTMSSNDTTIVSGKRIYIWSGSKLDLGGTLTSSYIHLDGDLTQNSNAITVNTSYTQSGGTFSGGDATIDINGSFTLSGSSTFTATSDTMTVKKDFIVSVGATFSHNNGNLAFAGNHGANPGSTINVPTTLTLNNLTIARDLSGYAHLTIPSGDTLVVLGDFTYTSGESLEGTGTIEVQGNVTIGANAGINSYYSGVGAAPTVVLNGSNDQTYTHTESGKLPNLEIDKTSGTVFAADGTTTLRMLSFTLTDGTFTAPSGTMYVGLNLTALADTTFNHNSGTLYFYRYGEANPTFDVPTSLTVNNLTIDRNGSYGRYTIPSEDTFVVSGNLTLTGYETSSPGGGTFDVKGNVAIGTDANGGASAITLSGTGTQTYTDSGGNEPDGDITISKPSGTLILASDAQWNATSQDLIFTGGTLDLGGYNLSVADQFTIGTGTTLKLHGDETITGGPDTVWNNATVHYNDEDATITM